MGCSIASLLHITPRSDSIFIDVSIQNFTRGVAGLSHVAVPDDKIPPTSDVVHLHTVGNVWINTSQVKARENGGVQIMVEEFL